MNVTLSADEGLLRKAREVARGQGLSLNEMFRRYLRSVTGSASDADPAAGFLALVEEGQGRLNGQAWTREELHERR